ncbi:MAG: energy transducer TonB [Bacteroidetes bacterium]|nr:energy transducer TonB [Bacteroidota bacterium]MBK9414071.1 energy transducer TonB [Bacteroidota bacterium]
MIRILVILLFLVGPLKAICQNSQRFDTGLVVLKHGDTLNCLVEINTSYGDTVSYKTFLNNDLKILLTKDIRSIKTSFAQTKNIKYNNSEKLMTLIVDGKVKLYNYVTYYKSSPSESSEGWNPVFGFSHVIEMNDSIIPIDGLKFKKQGQKLFSDCSTLAEKIRKGILDYSTIAKVVKEYNSCGEPVDIASINDYERGKLKDGYKEGIWEYYDLPGELSLKVNYDNAQLLYLISDTSEYAININGEWIYSKLDMQPRYIGSLVEFYTIIGKNLRYPNDARDNNTAGLMYMTFEIDTMGHINNMTPVKDLGDECSKEVIRAIKLIPDLWLPAIKNGKKYVSRFILPVSFELTNDGKITEDKNIDNDEPLPIAKTLETVNIRMMGITRRLRY